MLNAALTQASSQGAARTPVSHDFSEPSEPPDSAGTARASEESSSSGASGASGSAGSTDSSTPAPAARNVTRIITGADGREWVVRELPPPSYDRRRGPSLLFSADDVWRRVRKYPLNWHERSDADLYELSLGV